jgi:hypothetical protein
MSLFFPRRRDVVLAIDKKISADDGEIHLSSLAEQATSLDPRGHVVVGTDLLWRPCHVYIRSAWKKGTLDGNCAASSSCYRRIFSELMKG